MSAVASLDEFLEKVAQRDGHQSEFLQAVREVSLQSGLSWKQILNIVQKLY